MPTPRRSAKKPTKRPALRKLGRDEVGAYYARIARPELRKLLEATRQRIRQLFPKATEVISYQLPTFVLDGGVVALGAGAKFCSLYTLSRRAVALHAKALEGFSHTISAIHFTPERPLPDALLASIVRARLVENAERAERKRR